MKVLHNTCNMYIYDFPDMKALIPWACGHLAFGIHVRQISHANFTTIILCDQICLQVSYTCTVQVLLSLPFDRYDNSVTVYAYMYHCQKFNGLLLLSHHSWACLVSMGAWVAFKWLTKQTAGRELLQDYQVRLSLVVATFGYMWG